MQTGTRDIDPTIRDVLRFWQHVKKTEDCWLWCGARNQSGYGMASAGHKTVFAHRMSWRIHRGVIPLGLIICHKCDNPPCVRPEHLFVGTHKDNIQDAIKKGRFVRPKSKLSGAQIASIVFLVRGGMSHAETGRLFGVDADHVRAVLERERGKARRL